MNEPVFQTNSRSYNARMVLFNVPPFEENALTYVETQAMQLRLAWYRSATGSMPGDRPGTLLPASFHWSPAKHKKASFHGSSAKRKKGTEDALAVCQPERKASFDDHHNIRCNPEWPEIVETP